MHPANEKKGARPNGRAPFFPMQPHCGTQTARHRVIRMIHAS